MNTLIIAQAAQIIVRAIIQVGAGRLIERGFIQHAEVDIIAGAIVMLFTIWWSWLNKQGLIRQALDK